MVDKQILRKLKELERKSVTRLNKQKKFSDTWQYYDGMNQGIKACIAWTQYLMKKAGKKID